MRFTPALAAACLLATLILAVQQSYQESESFHSRPDAPANGHSLRVPENYRYLCKIMVQGCVGLLHSDSHVLANYAKTPLSFYSIGTNAFEAEVFWLRPHTPAQHNLNISINILIYQVSGGDNAELSSSDISTSYCQLSSYR